MIFDINAQIKKIKDMMIEKTSKKDFRQIDCHYFCNCYEHLETFDCCVDSSVINVKDILE